MATSANPAAAPKQAQGLTCPNCDHDLSHVRKTTERYGAGHHRTAWECNNHHCPVGEVTKR